MVGQFLILPAMAYLRTGATGTFTLVHTQGFYCFSPVEDYPTEILGGNNAKEIQSVYTGTCKNSCIRLFSL
jgi:hypothetical protein